MVGHSYQVMGTKRMRGKAIFSFSGRVCVGKALTLTPDNEMPGLCPRTLLLCGVESFRHMCVLLHCSPPSLLVFAPRLREGEIRN